MSTDWAINPRHDDAALALAMWRDVAWDHLSSDGFGSSLCSRQSTGAELVRDKMLTRSQMGSKRMFLRDWIHVDESNIN